MTVDEHVARCVVRIDMGDTFGSGFFVAESTVLTCAHVVAGEDEIRIVWNGTELAGTVTSRVPAEAGDGNYHAAPDLAVITLRDEVRHPCAPLADPTSRPPDGTGVTAHGFSPRTLSESQIGRDSRYLTIAGLSEDGYLRVTRDSVPEGMSGGPVVDPRTGRVAGVLKASVDSGGVRPVGGWMVTVAMLDTHLPDLVAENRRAHGTIELSATDYLAELAEKDEPPRAAVGGELPPAHYLDPRRRIVGFLHRPELEKLVEWCRAHTRWQVRLVCGPGGAGKTRLSVELVDRVRRMPGWTALRVRRGDVDLEQLASAVRGRKVLLCLEDGEEWAYDLPALLEIEDHEHLRILMLVRTYNEWWGPATEGHGVELSTIRLEPLGTAVDRGEILRQAYRDFRSEIAPNAPEETPPVLVNAVPDATNALELLAAALAVLLHCRDHDGHPPDGEIRLRDSLYDLLVHERRWWNRWAREVAGLDKPAAARDFGSRVLLLPALYLAAGPEQGRDAVTRAFSGRELADDLPGRVADTLHRVWPPRRPDLNQHWDALRPDPLGETLVLEVLAEAADVVAASDLVSGLFKAGVDRAQAEHALTVLTRAERAANEDVRDRVLAAIRALFDKYTDVFLPAGMFVAAGLSEPGTLIHLMRAAAANANEQTLRDAAVVALRDDTLASLEAHLWQLRAKALQGARTLTASERLTIAEQYRWATDAHVRAEENSAAFTAVTESVKNYGMVSGAFRSRDVAEDYASVSEMAAEVAERVGEHDAALRHIRRATDLRKSLRDDSAIQANLRFEAEVLDGLGRTQEADAVRGEARQHAHTFRRKFNQWVDEIFRPADGKGDGWSSKVLSVDDGRPKSYEGPRPDVDDPALRLVVPVGHFAGPMYTSHLAEAPDSFEIRFRDGIYSLSAEEYAVWAVSHGDPNLVNAGVPTTKEVVEYAARAAGVDEPGPVFDGLVSNGLLVDVGETGTSAREFAREHRVIPLALGLGNSPQNPAEFQIGLPNAARVSVGYDVYHMWLFSYRTPTLWHALQAIADEGKEANEDEGDGNDGNEGVRLIDDPDLLLDALLRALQVLVSTSCVFVDRCD